MKYQIGYKYQNRSGKECTIIDFHKTYNFLDVLVKERYVVSYMFCGNTLIDYDVVQTTIDMSREIK